MEFKTYTVLALIAVNNAAFAWQPLTYPIRSQSPYERSVDSALCYAQANKQTKVNTVRESQIPPRKVPAAQTSSTGVPSRPPLPSSTFTAAPTSASMPAAATEPGASAPAATVAGASAPMAASSAKARGVATAEMTASAASADGGASDTEANAASSVKLPPLPAPEPPMTQYWAAYGACMQAKGYIVSQ